MEDKLNIYGIFIGDIFRLNYYGINVFFMVCKTEEEKVYIAELKIKTTVINGEKVDIPTKNITWSKNPYIVKENNNYTYTNYGVVPILIKDVPYLPIKINFGSDLYKDASKFNDYVKWGTMYAYKIDNFHNKYFERLNEKVYKA